MKKSEVIKQKERSNAMITGISLLTLSIDNNYQRI